jgi:hypothetical protein
MQIAHSIATGTKKPRLPPQYINVGGYELAVISKEEFFELCESRRRELPPHIRDAVIHTDLKVLRKWWAHPSLATRLRRILVNVWRLGAN